MFCVSFCASLIAGSRRAFLCVDCVRLCLFVTERVRTETEWNELGVNVCFSKSLFIFVCFSSLENYFGLRTTNVKGKTDHSDSLKWNKKFWSFPKRRVFFWLYILFICELISPCLLSLGACILLLVNTFLHAQIYYLCRTSIILLHYPSKNHLCA